MQLGEANGRHGRRAARFARAELPPAAGAVAAYEPWAISTASSTRPASFPGIDGNLRYKGKIGAALTREEGYLACQLSTPERDRAAEGRARLARQGEADLRVEGVLTSRRASPTCPRC